MELQQFTTAFLVCLWENDVVGSNGAFVARCRDESLRGERRTFRR